MRLLVSLSIVDCKMLGFIIFLKDHKIRVSGTSSIVKFISL